jgi:hypothetical protein
MWLLPVHVPIVADTSVALPQLLEQVRERLKSNGDVARQIQGRRAKIAAICHEARKKSVDRQDVGGKTDLAGAPLR